MSAPPVLLATAVVLTGAVIVLGGWGHRAGYRPRHAGGSGPAARRLAALRLEHYGRDEYPTIELIGWPLCDPDEQPHLFGLARPAPVAPWLPPAPEPSPAVPPHTVPSAADTTPTAPTAPAVSTASAGAVAGADSPDLAMLRRVLDGLHRL
ncbi:hypothetical protein CDG81_18685 [Actinopolyspora erythraea]|uniref:DUF2550 domain-containing protein n=1 Tax=Actinopolyspora erythraea TaxID=414996 RepID=A0A099DAC6_9ACTN|nr:hypothetical protein [Actinopolyspora erythraea]ASU79954.1 hypothetical protein CDG81_18685 [Actinopolyspora erythraea]KGI82325.1 hypothetical protein IL38_06230 [Actinopolyspora erythraea]